MLAKAFVVLEARSPRPSLTSCVYSRQAAAAAKSYGPNAAAATSAAAAAAAAAKTRGAGAVPGDSAYSMHGATSYSLAAPKFPDHSSPAALRHANSIMEMVVMPRECLGGAACRSFCQVMTRLHVPILYSYPMEGGAQLPTPYQPNNHAACTDSHFPIPGDALKRYITTSVLPACAGNSTFSFLPVAHNSFVFQLGSAWGFTAFAIVLGSSYFQRLVCAIPQLEFAVRQNPK